MSEDVFKPLQILNVVENGTWDLIEFNSVSSMSVDELKLKL